MKNEKFDYMFFVIVVFLLLVLAIAAHGQAAPDDIVFVAAN